MVPARSDYGSYANSVIGPSYALRFPPNKSKAYIQSTACTLRSVLDDHIKLLQDTVSHLNGAVKQTQVSDYLAKPDRLLDSSLLQFIVDDRLGAFSLPLLAPSGLRHPGLGYKFLDVMAFEYWPQRNSALPMALLDLANVEEPATVRDLQLQTAEDFCAWLLYFMERETRRVLFLHPCPPGLWRSRHRGKALLQNGDHRLLQICRNQRR